MAELWFDLLDGAGPVAERIRYRLMLESQVHGADQGGVERWLSRLLAARVPKEDREAAADVALCFLASRGDAPRSSLWLARCDGHGLLVRQRGAIAVLRAYARLAGGNAARGAAAARGAPRAAAPRQLRAELRAPRAPVAGARGRPGARGRGGRIRRTHGLETSQAENTD